MKDGKVNDGVEKAYAKAVKGAAPVKRLSVHFVAWSADGLAALLRWSGGVEGWTPWLTSKSTR